MPVGIAGLVLAAHVVGQQNRQWTEFWFDDSPGPSLNVPVELATEKTLQHPVFQVADGRWVLRVTAADTPGKVVWPNKTMTIEQGHAWMPWVRVSEYDPRYFEDSSGASFFPLGANLRQPDRFSDLLARVSKSGGNTARLLVPSILGAGAKLDPVAVGHLESAFETADQEKVRVQLVVFSMDGLESKGPRARWAQNPLNRANGGPLASASEFWTNPEAEVAVKAALHELVARFSATPSLLAWELFDRASLEKDAEAVASWHRRIAEYLKQIDPYAHPVTSGFASPLASRELEQMPEIDLATSQIFSNGDVGTSVALMHYRKSGFNKPHLVTAAGSSFETGSFDKDPKGFQTHDALWSSIAAGTSGGAFPWWWDTPNLPPTFYRRFLTASRFIEGIQWHREQFRPIKPKFAYQSADAPEFYNDLVMEGGPISMDPTEYNWPRLVRIDPKRVRYGLPVAGILHGRRNHPSKHNPITFRMDLARPTVLDITVGDVSGQGGARLKVTLDGKMVFDRDFPDPNDAGEPPVISTFRQKVSLPIPAGHRVLKIENVGRDWMHAGYRLRDLFPRKTPPLMAIGSAGDNTAIVWVRHEHRSWQRMIEQRREVVEVPPTAMTLEGLRKGKWRADLWDTWTGVVTKSQTVTVPSDGVAELRLPAISTDLAIRLTRIVQSGTKR